MLLFGTAEVDNLHGMDFKYGPVTEIFHAAEEIREQTSLTIEDQDGNENKFVGLGAYEAVKSKQRGVQKYLDVIFCTYKGTNTVVAILKG